MNTRELVDAVAKKTGSTKSVAQEVVKATIEAIQEKVKKGQKVKLAGFGKFEVVKRAARKGRNPFNGEAVSIPAAKHPKFRPSRVWRETVNKR